MPFSRIFAAALAAAAIPTGAGEVRQPPAVAFVNVHVIPMDGDGVLRNQTVIVAGERIDRIGPAASLRPPRGATVVDGRGRFLVPGYVDMHIHLETPNDFPLYLANGVTTIRNLRGRPDHLETRRRLASGEVLGPVLYTSGPFTNQPGVMTAADAERAVADQKRAGYDFVKVHGPLTREAFLAMTAAGRRQGIPVVGHPPINLPFEASMEAGLATWEHAEDFEYVLFRARGTADSTLRAAAAALHAGGVPVTPTLVVFGRLHGMVADVDSVARAVGAPVRFVPPGQRTTWTRWSNSYTGRFPRSAAPSLAKRYDDGVAQTRALARQGATLLVGTDAGRFPTLVPGFSFHEELRLLAGAGLTPARVLRAATRDAAEALGRLDEMGTVTAGKRADLVLLDADPLDDVANAARIAGVMTRGRWLPKGELERRTEAVAAEYARTQRWGDSIAAAGGLMGMLQAEADSAALGLKRDELQLLAHKQFEVFAALVARGGPAAGDSALQAARARFPTTQIFTPGQIRVLAEHYAEDLGRPDVAQALLQLRAKAYP